MSAECHIHGCHLSGFMEDAYCPECKLKEARADLQALHSRIRGLADDYEEFAKQEYNRGDPAACYRAFAWRLSSLLNEEEGG